MLFAKPQPGAVANMANVAREDWDAFYHIETDMIRYVYRSEAARDALLVFNDAEVLHNHIGSGISRVWHERTQLFDAQS